MPDAGPQSEPHRKSYINLDDVTVKYFFIHTFLYLAIVVHMEAGANPSRLEVRGWEHP